MSILTKAMMDLGNLHLNSTEQIHSVSQAHSVPPQSHNKAEHDATLTSVFTPTLLIRSNSQSELILSTVWKARAETERQSVPSLVILNAPILAIFVSTHERYARIGAAKMVSARVEFATVPLGTPEMTAPRPLALQISILIMPITLAQPAVHQALTKMFSHEHVFLATVRAKTVSMSQRFAVHVIQLWIIHRYFITLYATASVQQGRISSEMFATTATIRQPPARLVSGQRRIAQVA